MLSVIHVLRFDGRIWKLYISSVCLLFMPPASSPACACVCACRWKPACSDITLAAPSVQGEYIYILHMTAVLKNPLINSLLCGVHTIDKSQLLLTISLRFCTYVIWTNVPAVCIRGECSFVRLCTKSRFYGLRDKINKRVSTFTCTPIFHYYPEYDGIPNMMQVI